MYGDCYTVEEEPLTDYAFPDGQINLNNAKSEDFLALIKLLEDLKDKLVESTRTCNASLRHSAISSIKSVLKQIRAQLNEASESSQSCPLEVGEALREVENSIQEDIGRQVKLSIEMGQTNTVDPSPETESRCTSFVQSIAQPCSSQNPAEPSITTPRSSRGWTTHSKEDSSLSLSNAGQTALQVSRCRSADQIEELSQAHYRADQQDPSIQPISQNQESPSMTVKPSSALASNKSLSSSKRSRSTVENSRFANVASTNHRPTVHTSIASESISSKSASKRSGVEQLAQATREHEMEKDNFAAADSEYGRRKTTKLSKILRPLRSQPPRTSSSFMDPVKLCGKLLTICTLCDGSEILETYSPETLHSKIVSMGPKGTEFLIDVRNALNPDQAGHERFCESSYRSQQGHDSNRPSSRTGTYGMVFEVPRSRPTSSKNDTRDSGEITGHLENGRSDGAAASANPTDTEILNMLKDLRECVENVESKRDAIQVKVDPQLLDLLNDVRESLKSKSGHDDPNVPQFESVSRPSRSHSNHSDSHETGLRKGSPTPPQYPRETEPSSVQATQATPLPQRSKLSLRETPSREDIGDSEMRNALNKIRQSICALESKESNSPAPEVLTMLTEVQESIRALSCVEQEKAARPEVINALEGIRATISSVGGRVNAAQEQASLEMSTMLECVRQSIQFVESTDSSKSGLENQWLMETLNDMRRSVNQLETTFLMSKKTLNPRIASMLENIRSSIRGLESNRASQRSTTDSGTMDIKNSLTRIEKKRSTSLQRPNVNLFLVTDLKKSVTETPLNSLTVQRRSTDVPGSLRSSSGPINQERLVASARTLDEGDQRFSEVKQSILSLQNDVRSVLEKQTEVVGLQLSEESSAVQLRDLAKELVEVRSSMRSLMDIVQDAHLQQTTTSRSCKPPPRWSNSAEGALDHQTEQFVLPICERLIELLKEMKAESATVKEMLRCVGTSSPLPEPPQGGLNISTPSMPLWKTELVAPATSGSLTTCHCVSSSLEMPPTFTLSFARPQLQEMDPAQPMLINIDGRTFKCSKM